MITAKQAYANHVRWKLYSPTEKFVYSVLDQVITDERIKSLSLYKKDQNFGIEELLRKIFLCEEKTHHEYTITGWLMDYSDLPTELEGYTIRGIIKELQQLYEIDPRISFVCKAFKALIHELEVVRGFKVSLDLKQGIFNVSWDLSSAQSIQ